MPKKSDNLTAVNVTLTNKQKKTLASGGAIGLKPSQYGGPDVLHFGPVTAKRYTRNKNQNKGMRVNLTQAEYERSASGGKLDWGKVKSKLGDKKMWRNIGKKVGKEALKNADKILPAAVGLIDPPAGIALAAAMQTPAAKSALKLANEAVSGMGGREIAMPSQMGIARGYTPDTSGSGFLGPAHPAMRPKDTRLPDNSGIRHGGSFKAVGYGVRGDIHPARTPNVSHGDLPMRM